MSYTSLRLAMTHLVRDIHKVDGLIADTAEGRDHPSSQNAINANVL